MADPEIVVHAPYRSKVIKLTEVDAQAAPIWTINGGRLWESPTGWRLFGAWSGNRACLLRPDGKIAARGWWTSSGSYRRKRGGKWGGSHYSFTCSKKLWLLCDQSGFDFDIAVRCGINWFVSYERDPFDYTLRA